MPSDQYTHGHHASVVDAHATRTVANSAAYLEPHLAPGLRLLDVGCGPGTITAEFAERVGPTGQVLGIDNAVGVVNRADQEFDHPNLEFQVQSLYDLDLPDDSWDIVHAHQVLQHVSDPVAALREMRRVVRPGGIVAVRDADYAAMHWSPQMPGLSEWQRVYREVAYANDAEPDAGRWLMQWASEAGFVDITPSVGTWLFADDAGRSWWGRTWAERVLESSLASQATELGYATPQELLAMSASWQDWSEHGHGWFVVVHGELVCRG